MVPRRSSSSASDNMTSLKQYDDDDSQCYSVDGYQVGLFNVLSITKY